MLISQIKSWQRFADYFVQPAGYSLLREKAWKNAERWRKIFRSLLKLSSAMGVEQKIGSPTVILARCQHVRGRRG
jgi:hypothetical protein